MKNIEEFLLVFEIYKEDSNYTTTHTSVLNFDHPLPIISHFQTDDTKILLSLKADILDQFRR